MTATLCSNCTVLSRTGTAPRTSCKACDKAHALTELRALCPPGTTVYTILRSVSRSGMSRVITPLVIHNGEPHPLSYSVGLVLGEKVRQGFNDGLVIAGGGMDMGFHLVNSLSYALHGTDPKFQNVRVQGCEVDPSTTRPGYTLTHRWL